MISRRLLLALTLVVLGIGLPLLFYFSTFDFFFSAGEKAYYDATKNISGSQKETSSVVQVDPLGKVTSSTSLDDSPVLFERESAWGPCPQEAGCFEHLTIKRTGEVIMENKDGASKKQLTLGEVGKLRNLILELNLLSKNCTADMVTDYSATYTFSVFGKTKKVEFPGCEEELRQVDAFIKDTLLIS